jgi:predicted TIM-barrel fold metal-dependent hydrolase
MDIVDAQVHLGFDEIRPTLAEMNALGISAILADELWGPVASVESGHFGPGYLLPNGAWRCISPASEIASMQYPDRFSYIVRVSRMDPELEGILGLLKSAPHARGIRILPVWTEEETAAFATGAYDKLFDLAQELELPVFVFIPGKVELLSPYLKRFPRLMFIVDHCGMPYESLEPDPGAASNTGYFDEVLKLASHDNVALKWCHAQGRFAVPDYPYRPLWAHLRRAINAFGAQRLIWASDKSVAKDQTWANLLFCIRDNPEIGSTEKEWILGRSLRTLLNWPASHDLS